MPWDARSFRKHNKKLSLAQSKEAADIANHILVQTGDEGKAIRGANAAFSGDNADKKKEKTKKMVVVRDWVKAEKHLKKKHEMLKDL